MGNAFHERLTGNRAENQEEAIAYYRHALETFKAIGHAKGIAKIHYNLAVIYCDRLTGNRVENQEEVIACALRALEFFTRERHPDDYAQTQNTLGTIYKERLWGDVRANLEEAIQCYQRALEIYTSARFPKSYAEVQHNLGNAYINRVAGTKRENIEEAINCYQRALRVFTKEDFPVRYATTHIQLGIAYRERIVGEHWENVERAIHCHESALQVFTLEESPLDYARTQNNLGAVYMERKLGQRRENVEQAIACFKAALAAYATDATSPYVASTLTNLDVAYTSKRWGDRRADLEEALNCYKQAQLIYEHDPSTLEYAQLQSDIGSAYAQRLEGEKQANQEEAIACYERALQVFTLESFPRQHRDTQLNLALVQASRQKWQEAHAAYQSAMKAEDLLIALGTGVVGRDVILREGRAPALNDGYALTRLGRLGEAAVSLEHGRAHGLAEAMALDEAHPDLINDPALRTRYEQARRDLISMQGIINLSSSRHFNVDRIFDFIPGLRGDSGRRRIDVIFTEEYQKILGKFQAVQRELQAADELLGLLDVQVDETTLLQAAEQCRHGHAVLYLAATTWGSMAVAVLSSNPERNTPARFTSLDLPELTEALLDDLLEARLLVEKLPVSNSYGAAQSGIGFEWFLSDWPGETFRERAMALHATCEREGESSTFNLAAQKMLQTDWLAELVDVPLAYMQASAYGKLARAMEHYLLHDELQRCLEVLAQVALRPLARWLQLEGVTSCTLIPCGPLAAFPLLAAEIVPGQTMADLLVASVALNARSLLGKSRQLTEQSTVYALGDPRPTRQELEWAEAEAYTVAKLARKFGLHGNVKVREKATREELILALEKGYIVDASCHGRFDLTSPLDLEQGKAS